MMIRYVGLCCVLLVMCQSAFAAPKATREEHQLLMQQVAQLEQRLAEINQQTASKQALITLKMELNIMREELQALRSENERLRYEINTMQNQHREAIIAIDRRLQEAPSDPLANFEQFSEQLDDEINAVVTEAGTAEAAAETTDTEQATQLAATSQPSEPVDNKLALAAYRDAFMLLKQRQHAEAIISFQAFLENYPATKYSANAQYWLGEANYVEKNYHQALIEFEKVLQRYPASSKIPDARLKMGYTQYELEKWPEARATLGRLRAQLPDSKVAGLAQQRLERMDREGH